MSRAALLLAAFVAISCSKDDSIDEAKGPPPVDAARRSTTGTMPNAKPRTPGDPRLEKLFARGEVCTWNKWGMSKCPVADEIRKLAFNHQGDKKLAAGCASALADGKLFVRGLAAACMRGFNDSARIPQLSAGLDAFEAEPNPGVRVAIAWAFSNGNAAESGLEGRVVALVGKLGSNPTQLEVASHWFRSLFPRYVLGKGKPTRVASDFALATAKNGQGQLQITAIGVLGRLRHRADEACSLLVGLTTPELARVTVPQLARLGPACVSKLDPVIALIAKQLSTGKMYASETGGIHALLRSVPLTGKQLATLKRASKKNVANATGYRAKTARELDDRLVGYTPPNGTKKQLN